MNIKENGTAFDLLAIICSLLDKEEERRASIQCTTVTDTQIRRIMEKYKNVLAIVLNSSTNEYTFSKDDILYLNKELIKIRQDTKEEIFLLAIQVEHRLDMYSSWQNRGVLYKLEPLNTNAQEIGIAIYPKGSPRWDTEKSERNRDLVLNSGFESYMIIRTNDISPFEVVMHYWNDQGIIEATESGWKLAVAMSPVMDNAELNTIQKDEQTGLAIGVEGLRNEELVTGRVLTVFEELFSKQYGIIVFPEALGTDELVDAIKKEMRKHPERCTFVMLPTICCEGSNTLIVLGPGGIECLRQDKGTPFILEHEDGTRERENLVYNNQIHLLITHELGIVAFTICAELLNPGYYHALTSLAMVDTIICPSFSPGITAFKETMLKGVPLKILQLYINTCSAKAVSRNSEVPKELALVQVPDADEEKYIKSFQRKCEGECLDTGCYFDIIISYENKKFIVESVHMKCA